MLKTPEKLKLIQKLSELTQQQLANKIGVSFVAFNAWINSRSTPRMRAQDKIDELYREYTGEKTISEDLLSAKKNIVFNKSKKAGNILKKILKNRDIYESFVLALTYHSNSIEGSSLSENDTAAIIFDGVTLPNKTLVEQLEAKNHQTALEYLFSYLQKNKKINEDLVLKLHSILMNSIISDAGFYRRHGVRITGSNVTTANYLKVPELMEDFFNKPKQKPKDLIHQIAELHAQFEKIHPFADGNGRTGRLLIIAQLLQNNLPPAIIRQEKKRAYLSYLNKAQLQDDATLLEDFLCDAVLEGFDILGRK